MTDIHNTRMVHSLEAEGKRILLIGTAHVSRDSVDLVKAVIASEKPDTVAVELCESRYQSLIRKSQWQDMDIVRVIKEKKAFLLLSNLMLASFQKRLAAKLDVAPGEEMLQAIRSAEEIGAGIHLADRDIRTTLSRTWRSMGFRAKMKLLFHLVLSAGDVDDISAEDVEKMKQQDMLASLLEEVGQAMPVVREILIDERDRYLCEKIRSAPGSTVVAVVGAGHVPGIKACWGKPVDLAALETLPSPGRLTSAVKWALPLLVVALIGVGFLYGGKQAGTDMLAAWIATNAVLAGLGAVIALAHPYTIVSSMVAAPLTSLNPMIAAGWVSGLVEAVTRRPRVRDFEQLPEDILSVRGFRRNKVTKILLVVVMTNLGSSLGTLVAIPLMFRAL